MSLFIDTSIGNTYLYTFVHTFLHSNMNNNFNFLTNYVIVIVVVKISKSMLNVADLEALIILNK